MNADSFLRSVPDVFLEEWQARWREEARELQNTIDVFQAALIRDMARAQRSQEADEDVFDGDPDAMLDTYLQLCAQRARHDTLTELIAAAKVLSQG